MVDRPTPEEDALGMDTWLSTPLGREVLTLEEECLAGMLRDTFGYYLLQVGWGSQFAAAIDASRIRQRILLPAVARPRIDGTQVIASPDRLPIAADSVDAVFLPHTLEFSADARQVLRETERVLIPEGRVIVIGFNALSMWGLRRMVPRGRDRVPWRGSFLTPYRVGDWLSLLGFAVEMQEMMMFRPPWRRALLRQFSFLDTLGPRFWPLLGGVYAIRAVKRVSTLTPMRPSWRRRPVISGGAVEPTARNAHLKVERIRDEVDRGHA
jgi:SAM-dependent methyltransferase